MFVFACVCVCLCDANPVMIGLQWLSGKSSQAHTHTHTHTHAHAHPHAHPHTGLNGSTTPSCANLELAGNSSSIFGNSSSWTNSPSATQLVLHVEQASNANVYYVVTFRLNNSAVGQAAPTLDVSASGSIEIAPFRVRGADGNAAPMVSRPFSLLFGGCEYMCVCVCVF